MYSFSKEEVLSNQLRQDRETRKSRRHRGSGKKTTAAALVTAMVLGAGIWFYQASAAYAVVVNGQQVAVVEEKAEGEKAVQDFLAQTSQAVGTTVTLQDTVEFKQIQVDKKDIILADDVAEILSQELTVTVPAAVITINGQEAAALADKATAEQLLTKIKNRYNDPQAEITVLKTEIKEKVAVVSKDVPVDQLVDDHQAWQILTVGKEKMVSHQVAEGESLWTISRANKMSMEDLIAANPGIDPDKLSIGDKVNLVKAEPLLHVTTVAQCVEVKDVPFETKVSYDKSMLRGKDVVKQEGQKGSKEFQYTVVAVNGQAVDKQFIEAKVLTEPVDKVVVKGSKVVLASRGSGGSGMLMWPARGGISSRFGNRHGEFHTGLDINGSTGDPIKAAETGRVIDAGWGGGYGYMIKIDHGSGIQTWYAHLSKISCSVGDQVERGEVIGREGSTGRSTGSHLHFEVRIGGKAVNPLNYLD